MSRDSWAIELPPAPRFDSPEMAAEIGEVYWQALTREVPFVYFDDDPNIADAINDLNGFSDIRAPTDDGTITPQTLFRGGLPGDLVGPYLASSSGSTSLMARRPSSRGIRFRKLVWIS
jgi:hypothetical protein